MWRIARERALLAGGPAALMLQVAHPLVAAGVAAHSDFTADPLRRLHATLDAVLTVSFGDEAQVRATARTVAGRHRPVQGALPSHVGPFPAGTPYRADDPDLALWVFATLVWTAVTVTETFVRPVPPPERDAYYSDMAQLGQVLGVPPTQMPQGYAALEQYVQEQVRDVLAVDATAARIADQLLRPDPPIVAAPLRPLPALLAAGVLPPAVRQAYGLPWRRRERVALRVVRATSRRLIPVLPGQVRYWPHYLVARRRLR